jgi:uncharacterized membrane protein YhaH (DUF805 family)
MWQPYLPIQYSGVEVVLECQAKSLRAVRHMFIIASGLPPRQITCPLAFVGILRAQSSVRQLPWKEQPVVSYQPYPSGTAPLSPPPPLDLPHYGIGFVDAVKRGFKKYARFTGRASRSEYWWWTLFTFVTYLVLGLVTFAVGTATSRDGGRTPGLLAMPLLILFTIFFLGILLPTLAVTVRRLHDAGYSGLVALLFLLPYLGGLIIMIFALLPSSPAGAKYDPIPATPSPYNPYPPQNPYTSEGA